MNKPRPAWSQQFDPETLPELADALPLEGVTAEWAWGGATGAGVRVAVIDSGIDATHRAIGAPVSGYVEIREEDGRVMYDATPHEDLHGHGTACAGIIRWFAPDCALYSVRVLGPALSGRGAIFAAGLRWAIDNGMHVCNLSLGTTKRDFFGVLHELADQAYFRNVFLVAAANNLPVASFPSVYASVFSVAAHAVGDPYVFYYNPRPPVEFGARGVDVQVPWRSRGWITATGNSFAAPHLTGIVTRIRSKHPDLTAFQMKALLRALAANVRRPPSAAIAAHARAS